METKLDKPVKTYERDLKEGISHIFSDLLHESSLNRLWTHIANDPIAIVILTAFDKTYSYDKNMEQNGELMKDIIRTGYGFIQMKGHFSELLNGKTEPVYENVLFVIDNRDDSETFRKTMVELGEKYDQDSILYKDPENEKAILIGTNDTGDLGRGNNFELGTWYPNKMGDFYTTMKRGVRPLAKDKHHPTRSIPPFVFESADIENLIVDCVNNAQNLLGKLFIARASKNKTIL